MALNLHNNRVVAYNNIFGHIFEIYIYIYLKKLCMKVDLWFLSIALQSNLAVFSALRLFKYVTPSVEKFDNLEG